MKPRPTPPLPAVGTPLRDPQGVSWVVVGHTGGVVELATSTTPPLTRKATRELLAAWASSALVGRGRRAS
jgi:hypothetical protein